MVSGLQWLLAVAGVRRCKLLYDVLVVSPEVLRAYSRAIWRSAVAAAALHKCRPAGLLVCYRTLATIDIHSRPWTVVADRGGRYLATWFPLLL